MTGETVWIPAALGLLLVAVGMALSTQGVQLTDWLKWESEKNFCRQQVTVLAGSGGSRVLTRGMVVGKITASGKYVQFDDTASDGSEDAAGILIEDVTAPDGVDAQGVILNRGPALIRADKLVWPGTADAGEKTAALVQLDALGIKAGEGA